MPAVDAAVDPDLQLPDDAARAAAAAQAARFAQPGDGERIDDGDGAAAPGVGAARVPMMTPAGGGGGGAQAEPDQPGRIERDEAALQMLQEMFHNEDYALALVVAAANRLGDFQPVSAAARVQKKLVQLPRLRDGFLPATDVDARRTKEFDSLEL